MSDKYVEKTFLYLLVLSVLLHLAVYETISLIPPGKAKTEQGPTMVDLTDLPELADLPKPQPAAPKAQRQARKRDQREQLVSKEPAAGQERVTERFAPQAPRPIRPGQAPQIPAQPPQPAGPVSRTAETSRTPQGKGEPEPVTRGDGIFKPKTGEAIDRSKLFPSAGKLARLEDSYRRKYGSEVEKGETSFLNTDDIRFGSFLRRFEGAVYGVWHYPEAALMRGIEGTTPVRITFNRSGEIIQVELLESSGSGLLDDEVMRTLKQLGPIGSFPRGYSADTFKLIAFFQYGIGGGRLR
ncbi:MAG: TonB-dependent receptor [Geobacteraceae bacterium GWC2_58_44]|nr:MAG: TonB-dependent receptor [Geobacteraceae bacterium GWC2_58_44]HBG06799.1 TonB-dependent receptor [Geobacter sp.]